MSIRTRADLRTDLGNKLVALEDGGYGDFEYTTAELDTYLDLATARLYPAVYTTDSAMGLTITAYGSLFRGYVADEDIIYDRVFMVEDAEELDALVGWESRPDKIIGIDSETYSSINVYWTDAYVLPTDDVQDHGIPRMFEPLINLGALIEALEARQDTGVRGEPPPSGTFFETQLLDRLRPRYDALKQELQMSLPGMKF